MYRWIANLDRIHIGSLFIESVKIGPINCKGKQLIKF
jgi:hypothetical protein